MLTGGISVYVFTLAPSLLLANVSTGTYQHDRDGGVGIASQCSAVIDIARVEVDVGVGYCCLCVCLGFFPNPPIDEHVGIKIAGMKSWSLDIEPFLA